MWGVAAVVSQAEPIRFWECAAAFGEQDEQQRLVAIEQGWSSAWLAALKQHLHLRTSELEPLVGLSEATLLRRSRQDTPLDLGCSERLDRLMDVIGLAYAVFEDPVATETWLKRPHPLLRGLAPLSHSRTAIGANQVRRLLLAMDEGAPV